MSGTLTLAGLDGANPLAFLAALGTLRAAAGCFGADQTRLSWTHEGAWRPVLHVPRAIAGAGLVAALHEHLKSTASNPALAIGDDLNVSPEVFRGACETAARSEDREGADFLAAFGCDLLVTEAGSIQDTALRTMSGAGHQHFLTFMRTLCEGTTPEQLTEALFGPWRYADGPPSMRWDPADDRRYALRWANPSGDQIRTVRGANRLAVEGVPLLGTVPGSEQRLVTTGFRGRGARDTVWTWPIWSSPLTVDVVRTLLALAELQRDEPAREELARCGVAEVFRSRRLTVGKFRSFAPPEPS